MKSSKDLGKCAHKHSIIKLCFVTGFFTPFNDGKLLNSRRFSLFCHGCCPTQCLPNHLRQCLRRSRPPKINVLNLPFHDIIYLRLFLYRFSYLFILVSFGYDSRYCTKTPMDGSNDAFCSMSTAHGSIFGTHQTLSKPIVITRDWSETLLFMSSSLAKKMNQSIS